MEEGNIPFPKIPDVRTMITQNYTNEPIFFGCDASDDTPLVLYLPNSPWTSYTNYSYMDNTFTNSELDLIFENAFQLATYGNRTLDQDWPACLACAAIKGSLRRVGMDLPDQCTRCFEQHCWNGKESSEQITEAELDLRPKLDPELSFKEWNDTIWTPALNEGQGSGSGSEGSKGSKGSEGVPKNEGGSLSLSDAPLIMGTCIALVASGFVIFA